jgi:hypothetical protein
MGRQRGGKESGEASASCVQDAPPEALLEALQESSFTGQIDLAACVSGQGAGHTQLCS